MARTAISQSNTKKAIGRKVLVKSDPQIFDEYVDIFTSQVTITTIEWADRLGDEFLAWCMNDKPGKKAYNTCEFYLRKGIPEWDWYRLIALYPNFKRKFEAGKRLIGSRRLQGCMECEEYKPLKEKTVHYIQHHFDPEWIDADKYHDARKIKVSADSAGNPGNTEIHVHMDQIPDSGIVPNKKKEDDDRD